MHHHKTYMHANYQQNWISRSVKTVHTKLFAKIASCINMQLAIVILKEKSIISNIHHRKTYMLINFQQNRVSRSVKTVRTNIFAKNCKLHTFATTNSIFKHRLLKTFIIIKRTCMRISAKSG